MLAGLRFVLRGFAYDLRKGLLARPGTITVAYGALAVALVLTERRYPELTGWASRIAWIQNEDVAASQLILATIAGSMMTTIAVVFSVLIMALSLASLQFSPRVLQGFMGDRPTQNTLGIFMGTFVYCLLVLRTVQGGAAPFVPAASVSVAMALAVGALAWLTYFIHHIAHGIHANHLLERVASETLAIIDDEFPVIVGRSAPHPEEARPTPSAPADAALIEATGSGYVQLVNRSTLLDLAREHELVIYQQHGVGEFAINGNPLLAVTPASRVTAELREACVECFDLGEDRTMQQDFLYGVRQIVDISLKAISPAVNDPTTANTGIDQLARVLCHLARRRILPVQMSDEQTGKLLMVRRAATFRDACDLAFNQLRQYGRGDMAVSLRLMRACAEILHATDHPPHRERALYHARLVVEGLLPQFLPEDRQELSARYEALQASQPRPV